MSVKSMSEKSVTKLALFVLSCLAVSGNGNRSALAAPPLNPIPQPLYSFDSASPTATGMPDGVASGSILTVESPGTIPGERARAQNLGLADPNDDLDGLSFNRAGLADTDTFVLMFSVDRQTTGDVPSDATLVAAGVPFNVADQADKGHAAGDGFISLVLFNRDGPAGGLRGLPSGNVQIYNNADEGGNDFKAVPDTSSSSTTNEPLDHVNGMSSPSSPSSLRGSGLLPAIYYTVSPSSPSLQLLLPGNSGADIFQVQNPDGPPPQPIQRFASAEDLGLNFMDDIGALVVFDENSNGVFDGLDQVLFSLNQGSPSLDVVAGLPDVSENGAADVFSVRAGQPGQQGVPSLFARAADFGLAGPNDNLAGVSIVLSSDAEQTALNAAIRSSTTPVPTVGQWGLIILGLLLVTAASVVTQRKPIPVVVGESNLSVPPEIVVDYPRLRRTVGIALGLAVVGLVLAAARFGTVATRDVVGLLISASICGVIAYLWRINHDGR